MRAILIAYNRVISTSVSTLSSLLYCLLNGFVFKEKLKVKIVLSVGQTDAIFCRNIVQHCWHSLRLVAFFSDETGLTDARTERNMSTHVLV